MGYYTRYSLKIVNDGSTESFVHSCTGEPIKQLVAENKHAVYALEEDGSHKDEITWYDHEKEMRAFSKKFPNLIFELSGEGEMNSDVWKKYFKNGKCQICKAKISFDEFDESKLV